MPKVKANRVGKRKSSHSHKTKKRLEIKKQMLDARGTKIKKKKKKK
jgi:hypothetical protein